MPFCPDCGIEVSEGYQFCPECGRPLAVGEVVVGGAVKGKNKKKIAGIITACAIAIIVAIVLLSVKPWERTYTLSVSVNPPQAGFVSPWDGEYESGAQVTLTASPASGYAFDHWSGGASGTTPIITIAMDSDKNLTAHFETTPTVPEVLFSDDFSDESSGWVTYDEYDGRVAYLNGCLYIKDYTYPDEGMYGESQRYFTDFILEVETWLVDGTNDNWHSVACRCQDNYENYYVFGISADGYYEISKFVNGNRIALVSPTYSSYINQGVGAVNLIHIECIGSSLSLSVNGHELASVVDTTFSGGDIALAANALAGTFTEVAFDNIIINEPSETIPEVPEVLFSDDFSDESSGWVTYDEYDGRVAYLNGCLYIKDYTDEVTIWGECQRYFTDFILEVETWLVDGTDDNWHAVICRFQDDDNHYTFDISADGYYEMQKWVDGDVTNLVGPTYSSYIHQGQGVTNLVHIECIGSSLSLSVNGHELASVVDTTFSGGDIALAANALAGTFTEVAFDNIVVSEP